MNRPLFPIFLQTILAVLFLSASSTGQAQWGLGDYPVEASASAPQEPARRGTDIVLTISAEVDEGYHIYAMDLQHEFGEFGPYATMIELSEESRGLLSGNGGWKAPESTVKWDPGFEANVAKLYGSPLEFTRTYTINRDIEPGEYTITGTLGVQACTEESCKNPTQLEWSTKLIVNDEEPAAPRPEPTSSGENLEDGDSQASPETGATTENQENLLAFMVGAFFFGLLALLTPCVFPMIPITISFFTNKSAKSTGRAAGVAAIYVGSIILGFMLIGLGISVVMRLLGAGVENSNVQNAIAANPWVNIFFALLYIFFFFVLLEVFHLAMPSSLTNRLNNKAMKSTGVLSIFFKALVFVLISFTCTAPLIGLLIVEAMTGGWTRPFFGMLAFATGFALPFFFLAMAPQLLSSLPKSGSWLYAVKVVMAMLVLAASFKFISNADLILLQESMIFTREVLLAIWTAIAAVTGFYLLGIIKLPADDPTPAIGIGRLSLGTFFASMALYLASGLFGSSLHPEFESYLPPNLRSDQVVASSSRGNNDNALPQSRTETGGSYISADYSWFTEVEEAKRHAAETGRNVFIDFTGYTCTNCRLMEKKMFPKPQVAELLEQYVRVKLYIDDPEDGKERAAYQAKTFGAASMPFYAIITPEEEILATEAFTRDTDQFVSFLKKGLGQEVALARDDL